MEKILFTEKQKFPLIIPGVILFFTLSVLIFGGIQVQRDDPDSTLWYSLICLLGVVPVIIIFFVAIEVKITDMGVYYRSLPFRRKFKFLPKDEITLSYKKTSRGRMFGSYGIKTRGYNKYLLIGIHNIHIVKGKRTIMIGTKKPREFQYLLSTSW